MILKYFFLASNPSPVTIPITRADYANHMVASQQFFGTLRCLCNEFLNFNSSKVTSKTPVTSKTRWIPLTVNFKIYSHWWKPGWNPSIRDGVLCSGMLLYLHHRDSKIFFHPAKFDNFKDEKISDFKTVSVLQRKNLLDWKLVV